MGSELVLLMRYLLGPLRRGFWAAKKVRVLRLVLKVSVISRLLLM